MMFYHYAGIIYLLIIGLIRKADVHSTDINMNLILFCLILAKKLWKSVQKEMSQTSQKFFDFNLELVSTEQVYSK